jgi:hypothetical protein
MNPNDVNQSGSFFELFPEDAPPVRRLLTPAEFKHKRLGERLARRCLKHGEQLGPAIVEIIAPTLVPELVPLVDALVEQAFERRRATE